METKEVLIHGTCVALGNKAVLIQGPSGSGKSDLALRLLNLPTDSSSSMAALQLVSDDQVLASRKDNKIIVRAPETIAGKLEVRGIGIIELPYTMSAILSLLVQLVSADKVPRIPPVPLPETEIIGISVPTLCLAPFEPSSPVKLRLALSVIAG